MQDSEIHKDKTGIYLYSLLRDYSRVFFQSHILNEGEATKMRAALNAASDNGKEIKSIHNINYYIHQDKGIIT